MDKSINANLWTCFSWAMLETTSEERMPLMSSINITSKTTTWSPFPLMKSNNGFLSLILPNTYDH